MASIIGMMIIYEKVWINTGDDDTGDDSDEDDDDNNNDSGKNDICDMLKMIFVTSNKEDDDTLNIVGKVQ